MFCLKNDNEEKRVHISYLITKIQLSFPMNTPLEISESSQSNIVHQFLKIVIDNDSVNRCIWLSFEQMY